MWENPGGKKQTLVNEMIGISGLGGGGKSLKTNEKYGQWGWVKKISARDPVNGFKEGTRG